MAERLGHVIKQIPALLLAVCLNTPEPFQPAIVPCCFAFPGSLCDQACPYELFVPPDRSPVECSDG
ncbi:MAG: hypothetical protein PHQ75_02880 [Thermoguttaceae bacterium]|nr:hypothetical protein [Thermoguttaceae bacterium]